MHLNVIVSLTPSIVSHTRFIILRFQTRFLIRVVMSYKADIIWQLRGIKHLPILCCWSLQAALVYLRRTTPVPWRDKICRSRLLQLQFTVIPLQGINEPG